MKTLQNNFTTPEQSKRLLELGVPADSADCYFLSTDGIMTWVRGVTYKNMNWFGTIDKTPIPCWSTGRLIEIFEICTGQVWQNGIIDGYTKVDMLLEDFEDRENKYHFDFSELEV